MAEIQTILYVDDEEPNLLVFEAAFEDDYDVRTANSGNEALKMLEEDDSIELVITDMRMPGMGGVELLEQIFARHPDTVRMVLTGYTDLESLCTG